MFAIDVAAYAVMSNHYHIVLRIDRERAEGWSDEEVLARWTQLFTGPLLVRRYLDAQARETLDEAQRARVGEWAQAYRERLADLSWYMRVLNEGIARLANKEDQVKGRFWEGRFKSQALLDEQAVLTAMAYVDLNPIRAAMAETPEESDYTSLQARLLPEVVEERMAQAIETMAAEASVEAMGESVSESQPAEGGEEKVVAAMVEAPASNEVVEAQEVDEAAQAALLPAPLLPFDATGRETWAIPYAFEDYVDLPESAGWHAIDIITH